MVTSMLGPIINVDCSLEGENECCKLCSLARSYRAGWHCMTVFLSLTMLIKEDAESRSDGFWRVVVTVAPIDVHNQLVDWGDNDLHVS